MLALVISLAGNLWITGGTIWNDGSLTRTVTSIHEHPGAYDGGQVEDVDLYVDSQIRIELQQNETINTLVLDLVIEIYATQSSGTVYAHYDESGSVGWFELASPSNQVIAIVGVPFHIGISDVLTLQLWMPDDPSWGYYDITIMSSQYSDTDPEGYPYPPPILCSLVHSTI